MGFHKWRAAERSWRVLKPRARTHRREPTEAEALLWSRLRARMLHDAKFRRQHAIGTHIVDFCCPVLRLIVEIDGSSHEGRGLEDQNRTRELESHGFRVIRFTNEEVLNDCDSVVVRIGQVIDSST